MCLFHKSQVNIKRHLNKLVHFILKRNKNVDGEEILLALLYLSSRKLCKIDTFPLHLFTFPNFTPWYETLSIHFEILCDIERKKNLKLNCLWKRGSVGTTWQFSKVNCFNTNSSCEGSHVVSLDIEPIKLHQDTLDTGPKIIQRKICPKNEMDPSSFYCFANQIN